MPFVIDGPGFERRFRPEGLDTQASIVLMSGDQPAGVCLIARQGWTSRVAAMAIAPDFRAQGIGKQLMNLVIDESKARNDRRMVLEVIEQNPPAIGLYESVGMSKTRRLVGYRREPSPGLMSSLSEIDPSEVIRSQVSECDADLPWDFKPETLALKVNTVGFSLESKAFTLVSEAPNDRVIIWTLFVRKACRLQGLGTRLVEGLAAKYPDKALVMPVALPDDLAPEFFSKTGFVPPAISQFEMAISFSR